MRSTSNLMRPKGEDRMRLALLAVTAAMLAAGNLVLTALLLQYRIDKPSPRSPFDGKSQIAQFNYLDPSNYSDAGQRWLLLLYIGHLALIVVLGVLVFT